ncbi:MAG: class I SAM-dependent methyltransferase [Candidatus Omnitrophica bacterium]|nr:class I SAM-dependent methyltransferase [Candidatus Omnitrophota bacterium]MDD5353337.1 class I SAM-dependent methyltransferase [Candidatus Omnitrophota bacterium]MDD5591875.1 class I SAM-dependent methyltransferase [Candidatus Omnitrophota bacterium]
MALDKEYKRIKNCRICGSKDIVPLLFLGNQPLANSFKKRISDLERRYPLTLVFCPNCSLVQLKETLKKEILFNNYVWVTGISETTQKYAETFYKRTIGLTKAKPEELIVEIASNDGTFLKPFVKGGYRVLGIEPAKNIAGLSKKSGIETLNRYWDHKMAGQIKSNYGEAKVVIARNVIPHVSDLTDVIRSIHRCLAKDGIGIIEFHYAGKILQDLHYDSIYHEHLCYFSIKTMEYLLNKFNLFPFRIDLSPISGGSYVMYFSKNKRKKSLRYNQLVDKEKRLSVNKLKSWQNFADKCKKHRKESRKIIKAFRGKAIVGFGASARSATYLNFCGFTNSDIRAIIDNNRLKQGLYSPGSSIPILSIEEGLRIKPDLLFILAWNFKDEIIADCQLNGYKRDYLIPFPKKPYLLKVN